MKEILLHECVKGVASGLVAIILELGFARLFTMIETAKIGMCHKQLGMMVHERNLALQLVPLPEVVGIQERDVFATGLENGPVARRRLTTALLLQQVNAGVTQG